MKAGHSKSLLKTTGSIFIYINLVFLPFFIRAQSPIAGLNNKDEFDSLVLSIARPLYNLRYDETNRRINNLQKIIPDHPIIDLLYAINISWQSLPEPLPEKFDTIKYFLTSSISKADKWLERDGNNPEPIFFLLMCHGLLAQYYNEQGSPFKTMSEAKKAYNHIIEGFELKKDYNEFLFSCGLYNYYIEKYPQMYPVYKPFTWLFKNGDISKGLQQLDSARKVTVLSKVESAHYLAYIYLRYEEMPKKAISILVPLVFEFPRNLYFKSLLIESYMMVGQMDQVADMLDDLHSSNRKYYQVIGAAFKGVLFEKYRNNDFQAGIQYQNAIDISETMQIKDINALALAYAGLARISARKQDIQGAKDYYKKSLDFARSQTLKDEAKSYIKEH